MSPMRPFLTSLLFFLALAPGATAGIEDDWFDPAFIESSTLNGGSGFILVPSPEVLPEGIISGAIHGYQVKLAYGFGDFLELGLNFDLEGYVLAEFAKNQLFFGRLRLLSLDKHGIGLSVGVDGVGPEDLGGSGAGFVPKPALDKRERLYAVAGLPLPFYPSLMVTAGWGTGAMPAHSFFNLSKVLIPGLLAMAEYDGFGTNFGARFLLSPRIKLDLDFTHTQEVDWQAPLADALEKNVRFGITYSESFTLSLAFLSSSGKPHAPKAKESVHK